LYRDGPFNGFTLNELFAASEAAKRLTFGDLPAAWFVTAICHSCGRETIVDRWRLAAEHGSDVPIMQLSRRLRCTRCDVRGASIMQFHRVPR